MNANGNYLVVKDPSELPDTMEIHCPCGRPLTLDLVGGQYEATYSGKCECGLKWMLVCTTFELQELEDEGPET